MSAPNLPAPWREVEAGSDIPDGSEFLHWAGGKDGPFRQWIMPAPKPLPTDPGTLITVTDGLEAGSRWVLDQMGWHRLSDATLVPTDELQGRVIDFTIDAAPPKSIAAAVLGSIVEQGITTADDVKLAAVAQQYGAQTGAADA